MINPAVFKKTFRSTWRNIGKYTIAILLDDFSEVDEMGGVERKETVIYFNETGSAIWNLIDGNATVEDIVVKLKKRFSGKNKNSIYLDVINVLGKLGKLGLIKKNGFSRKNR